MTPENIISALVAGAISLAVYQRSEAERVDRARDTAASQVRTASTSIFRGAASRARSTESRNRPQVPIRMTATISRLSAGSSQ